MKYILLLSMMLLSVASCVIAQEEEEYKGKDLTMPEVVKATNPAYPEEARKNNIEGIVYVKALIGAKGDVKKVKISKSDNKVFDKSALDAIRNWKFKPGTVADKAVPIWVTIPVKYKLEKGEKKK